MYHDIDEGGFQISSVAYNLSQKKSLLGSNNILSYPAITSRLLIEKSTAKVTATGKIAERYVVA
jgi:hypothetical protein